MSPARTRLLPACVVAACALVPPTSLHAQDEDRLWGRVETGSGDVHEGFLRWDRNEGSWVDVLDGSKELPRENYLVWLEGMGSDRAERVVEVLGYRVTWEEEHPDFALTSRSGIRFGHLASLEVVGRDRVALTLRSGRTVDLSGGASDLGPGLRRLVVDVPGDSEVSLRWGELRRVVFAAPPRARGRPPGVSTARSRTSAAVASRDTWRGTSTRSWSPTCWTARRCAGVGTARSRSARSR